MKWLLSLGLAIQVLSAAASPVPASKSGESAAAVAATARNGSVAAAEGTAAGAETAEANEIEQQAQFGVPIALGGGNIKVDTLFPPGVSYADIATMLDANGF